MRKQGYNKETKTGISRGNKDQRKGMRIQMREQRHNKET